MLCVAINYNDVIFAADSCELRKNVRFTINDIDCEKNCSLTCRGSKLFDRPSYKPHCTSCMVRPTVCLFVLYGLIVEHEKAYK